MSSSRTRETTTDERLSIAAAAAELKVSDNTVRNWISAGRLADVRQPGATYAKVSREQVQAILDDRAAGASLIGRPKKSAPAKKASTKKATPSKREKVVPPTAAAELKVEREVGEAVDAITDQPPQDDAPVSAIKPTPPGVYMRVMLADAGLDRAHVAEQVGIPETALAAVLDGHALPSIELTYWVAELTGLSARALWLTAAAYELDRFEQDVLGW